jgi:hypothetical protein
MSAENPLGQFLTRRERLSLVLLTGTDDRLRAAGSDREVFGCYLRQNYELVEGATSDLPGVCWALATTSRRCWCWANSWRGGGQMAGKEEALTETQRRVALLESQAAEIFAQLCPVWEQAVAESRFLSDDAREKFLEWILKVSDEVDRFESRPMTRGLSNSTDRELVWWYLECHSDLAEVQEQGSGWNELKLGDNAAAVAILCEWVAENVAEGERNLLEEALLKEREDLRAA